MKDTKEEEEDQEWCKTEVAMSIDERNGDWKERRLE